MLLGIVVATYWSIYVAAPILLWLRLKPDSFVPREETAAAAAAAAGPKGQRKVDFKDMP